MKLFLFLIALLVLKGYIKCLWNTFAYWYKTRPKILGHNSISMSCPLAASVNYTQELAEIRGRIVSWNRFHPFGALTDDERAELLRLKQLEVGVLLARSADLDEPFCANIIDELEGQDWRDN